MAVKRSVVEFVHDEGYGDELLEHINAALRGKDMRAARVYSGDLVDAAKEAFSALVGAHASDDSVQGHARIRLRRALGIS